MTDALHDYLKRHVPAERDSNRTARPWFALGRQFAPLFYGFVAWIIDQTQRNGFERVYYFTREGEFFAAIHRAIAASHPWLLPDAQVLEVSRVATLLPSLPSVSPATLQPLFGRYPRLSPAALLKTLNLDPAAFAAPLAAHRLSADEPLDNAQLAAFLNDPTAQTATESRRLAQRAASLDYLESRGLDRATDRAAVVDIGWHGSIQEHLARLLPDTDLHGYYFGLMCRPSSPVGDKAPPPVRRSFVGEVITAGHDAAIQYEFLKFVGPLEMLCNAPGGSVMDYEPRDDAAIARRRITPGEETIYENCTCHFQAGVLAAVPLLARYERETARDYRAHQATYWRQLRTLMTDPPRAIAVAYDRLHHDETFGHGKAIDMGSWIPAGLALKALLSASARRELRQRITTVPWPHGFLVARNLRFVCRWLNARYFAALYQPPRQRKAA